MSESKNWAMIKVDMHNDRKIEKIACEFGSRAIAYWTIFILESKKVHRSNDGWAGPFTLTQFAAMCYDEKSTKKSVRLLIEKMVQEGLLDVDGELLRRWYARPSKFLALQHRGARAEVEAKSKNNLQGKTRKQQPFDDKKSVEKSREKVAYTYTYTDTYKLVSKDTCQNDDFDPASPVQDSVVFKAVVEPESQPVRTRNDDVLEVFKYWVEEDTRTGGTVGAKKLTSDRRDKIKARLRDGYSVEQLKQSIDGFLSTPFYLGENDRNRRYTDFATIFKNGSQVEKGIELAGNRTGVKTGSRPVQELTAAESEELMLQTALNQIREAYGEEAYQAKVAEIEQARKEGKI